MIQPRDNLYGRRVIYSDVEKVDKSNVVKVIDKAKSKHAANRAEIDYLWDMYRGKQDIRNRTKEVRPDICAKITENRSFQIVSFEVGYLVGKPVTYVSADVDQSDAVKKLNDFMIYESKATEDQRIVMWQKICGTAYRLVLQKDENAEGESPFEIYTIEPQNAFVVYSTRVGHKALCGVYYYRGEDGKDVYCVYTPTEYFEIKEKKIVRAAANNFGLIPLIEYPANEARLGSIEIVAPLLNELNELDSNRLDSVSQFVQALLVFVNCLPPEGETASSLQEKGIIALQSSEGLKADIKMIAEQLDQTQTQVLKEDIYQSILEIVGMPSVSNGNTSDSSNNGAVILKNGWQTAEAKAEASENVFKKSEREMLRVVLRICRDLADIGEIDLANIQIHFPRQNYGDLQSKAQVLTTMLNNEKIHPKLAFEACQLWKDVEDAYAMSMQWYRDETAAIEEGLTDEGDGDANA